MAAKKPETGSTRSVKSPTLRVSPKSYMFPYKIQLFGTDWGGFPVAFYLDGETQLYPVRILVGERQRDMVKPINEEFLVLLNIPGLQAGEHKITSVAGRHGERIEVSAEFVLENVPETEEDGRPTHRWFRRQEHFMHKRFPDGINRLPGSRFRAYQHRDRMRRIGVVGKFEFGPLTLWGDPNQPSPPVDPGCNWYCIGPSVVRKGQVFSTASNTYTTAPVSGRITSIAYDPNDTNVIYAAAAQGGIWKSLDGGKNWQPKSDFEISLAMGCVTVDPSVTDVLGRSTRIFAGTGEPNQSDSYYGGGMLFSDDGGETWAARGTATFVRDEFSTIVVDPDDNQHIYAATSIGVFESIDEGVNWNQIAPGTCHDLVVDWSNPGNPELYVGQFGVGIRYSNDGGVTWSTLGGGLPVAAGRIALTMSPGNPNNLYTAFSDGLGGITGIYRTTDGGTTWTATGATPPGVAQSNYNWVVAVDPTDGNTVLFGEVHLWRTTDGGANWTRVSTGSPGIHPDQHAITYHPTNGSFVLVGNDGGVFYSIDGGVTFTHRNKDLAILQYYGVFNHPLWDAVILGGTQDNGAQRYLGHPAWEHSALGDGAFGAINSTTDMRRWYETRWWGYPCFRSDTAGSRGSWASKKSGITTNSNWFYPPLEMDPNDSSVLYVGYDELWRTSDHAENWVAIAGSLVGIGTNITAIAVSPSDSNTIYVGMQDGKVFKVTFSGGTWTGTDITSAPLPAGQISDIAVHPTDNTIVYVTTSNLIFSEGVGEFTNNHVFKSLDGGTTWNNISAGLAQTNPVNTVVIDPGNPDTIFIGCDVGIFRSDDGGTNWYTWDTGLPNCSVQDLKFFAPQRLLRAATHGRSVWERPVDATACPLVDVYMRDNIVDTGLTYPTPSGVDHPFNAGETVQWFQSVDIKIDSPDPAINAYQTPSTDIDYIQFEELIHDNPRRETWVRVFVQVHNRGNNPATNVQVRAFWANAGGGLPNLPADFWTAFPNTDPADTSVWHPVGPTRTIDNLYPGQPQICSWSWLVPTDAPNHTCMLSAVMCNEDDVSTTALNIGNAVKNDNNVTLKNLHVDDLVPGALGADEAIGPYFIDFAIYERGYPFDIRFNSGGLPQGAQIHFFFPDFKTDRSRKKALRRLTRIKPILGSKIHDRPDEKYKEPTTYIRDVSYKLDVDRVRKGKKPGLYGIIPKGEKFSVAFFVILPKGMKKEAGDRYTFHIEHWVSNDLIGGSSYEIRVNEKTKS